VSSSLFVQLWTRNGCLVNFKKKKKKKKRKKRKKKKKKKKN
jgi:hypothetical protein